MNLLIKYLYLFTGILIITICYLPVAAQNNLQNSLFNTNILNHKADSILSLMTLEEKVGQLTILGADHQGLKQLIQKGLVGGTNGMLPGKRDVSGYLKEMQEAALHSRLRIPLLFMGDVIHGYRTTFPVPLAESCTWDTSLIRQADSIAAVEATAAGMNWTFAPMVDISRDPRWGRVVEGAGEDPFLGAAFAEAAVRGFQGNNLSNPHSMLATAKHFAGYGAVEAGRAYNTVDMSWRRFRQTYLPPFQAAINAGVGSIMPAFISLNGIPASENSYLLQHILRKELDFKGLVVSDYDAVPELIDHGVAADTAEAVEEAIHAGMDMDLHSGSYLSTLPELVREGKVSETIVDSAVKKALIVKLELGLFKHPFRNLVHTDAYEDTLLSEHRDFAKKVAERSIVLLKNSHHILPLSKNIKTLAIIGPLVKDQENILGPVHAMGKPDDAVSVWNGIKKIVHSKTKLLYAEGTGIDDSSRKGFANAIVVANKADAVLIVVGESARMSGEGDSRSVLGLPDNQLDLVKTIMKTGKPVVVVLMNGRPLTIDWLHDHVPAIVETWLLGTEAGSAIANVLFGIYNPSGKLTMTFPRNTGQIPIYYDHLNTGRPFQKGNKYTSRYMDVSNSPLYPFGYGLSYTTFSYSAIQLNTHQLPWNDTLRISVTITNTSEREGTEIAQLYIHDKVASISPPAKELKGFKRVHLFPGESKEVTFILTKNDLAFYNKEMQYKAEPGEFEVFVGENSDTQNTAYFTLENP